MSIAQTLGDLNDPYWRTRWSALQTLKEKPRLEHAEVVARSLADGDARVRWAAAELLGAIGPAGVGPYAKELAALTDDENKAARRAAAEALCCLGPRLLAPHAPSLAVLLDDRDAAVRRAGARALGGTDKHTLWHYGHVLVKRLAEDKHCSVRLAVLEALETLGKLETAWLARHAKAIAAALEDEDASIRLASVRALSNLEPKALSTLALEFVRRLKDEDRDIRLAAAEGLCNLDPPDLAERWAAVARRLDDEDEQVQMTALRAVVKLDKALDDGERALLISCAAEDGYMKLVDFLVAHHRVTLLNTKNESSDTPLHLAAKGGHLGICQLLVRAGALTRVKNSQKLSPAEVAQSQGHADVFSFLDRWSTWASMRGGMGDALLNAQADSGPVIKVDWYTIALPGVVGSLGAVHSMLAITVGRCEEFSHTYVMEKADTWDSDSEQFKNGVHISHWVDVAPHVENDPIHSLSAAEIVQAARPPCMRTLRDIAVLGGPYDVGTSNCHHMALDVYNACAKDGHRVPHIPNKTLVAAAGLIRSMGVEDVVGYFQSGQMSSVSSLGSLSSSTSNAPGSSSIWRSMGSLSQAA